MYEAADLLRLIEPRLAELGMTQSDLGAAAFGVHDNSAVQGMKKGSIPSIDRVAAMARALGFECYFGPPRGRTQEFAEAPARSVPMLAPRPAGYAFFSWHHACQLRGTPPLAFSEAWITRHNLDRDRHLAVALGPTPADATAPATLAIIDPAAERRGGPALWALREKSGRIDVVSLQIGGGRTMLLPTPAHPAVRFLSSGTSDPNLLGLVLWQGVLTDR